MTLPKVLLRGENPLRRSAHQLRNCGITARVPSKRAGYFELLEHIASARTDSPFLSFTTDWEVALLHKGYNVGCHCVVYEVHLPAELGNVQIWKVSDLLRQWQMFGLISEPEHLQLLNQAVQLSELDSEYIVTGAIPFDWIAKVHQFNSPTSDE